MPENKTADNSNIIEINSFYIRKNVMEWGNTALQLSNISSISTYKFEFKQSFPKISILLFIIGAIILALPKWLNIAYIGYIFLAVSIGWICYWYYKKNNPDSSLALHIMMNSGAIYSIKFNNEKALNGVVVGLTKIMDAGGAKGDIYYKCDVNNGSIGVYNN